MLNKKINSIFNEDCIEGMKKLDDCSVDLIVADPPYNLNKNFGKWDEKKNKGIWLPWSKEWLNECNRVLKNNGSIFVYGIHHHLCWLQCHMYEIGLTYRRQIIWNYENGFSGYKNTLAAHYEPMLWFSKGESYTFNEIREPYKSTERLKHKITKNGKVWTPHPDGRIAGDVWKFPTLAGRRFKDEKVDHPTQKPLSISERIIKHFSNESELVLIPFSGSGSECVASKKLKRNFISFELNEDYIKIANQRLEALDTEIEVTI
ncbi:site-specific DNA-methyltransferase (adenine-specific) [Bathymodiolus platifrons methanotrophic gill symbiont]|uniref:DNA-methyltransferase n=1 Tax=Bathymodiolus platifrons methanotrophic gill symbiont TaxID=113268 RepID=UPI000B41DA27|nr:site-specific DNA-methyltransferase [Bathymodiolus platifrons methanotrophic gill symbiont]GAW87647.1 site-specific DNA-methyltransferase (adenine-specific) [Bathymodiolus platifrons methanotrophic gill symbiont]GFO77756.1 site-specific DNA-methyltransferase (adenine-specific) [Bathymodiolus platifrons methanotrophic gill symbiont]